MQFKIFCIKATGDTEQEAELNRFLESHRVLAVEKSLQSNGGVPHWCFCIEYLLRNSVSTGSQLKKPGRVDYKEVLRADEFALYVKLRDWRKMQAATEAIPVFSVFTNAQLADVACRKPQSLQELRETSGIGEAKAERYGSQVIAVISQFDFSSQPSKEFSLETLRPAD